jgi:phage gpG-like protein
VSKTKKTFKYDQAAIDNIVDFLKQNKKVKIGVLAGANHSGGIGAVELAAIHEFGSEKRSIPQRSFLRNTMMNRKDDFITFIEQSKEKIMERIATGGGFVVLYKIGTQWVRYVMETFDAQGPNWAPLAESTLMRRRNFKLVAEKNPRATLATLIKKARKGTKILQDTGEMKKSISFEVVDG